MIKVTIHFRSETIKKTFHKDTLVIGSGFDVEVDIPLAEQALYDEHIKIVKEAQGFVVQNLNEDPFVLLNEEAFESHLIHVGDVLQVGEAKIFIEGLSPEISEDVSDLDLSESELEELLSGVERPLPKELLLQDIIGGGEDEGFSEEESSSEDDLAEDDALGDLSEEDLPLEEEEESSSEDDLAEDDALGDLSEDDLPLEEEEESSSEDDLAEDEGEGGSSEEEFDIEATLDQLFAPVDDEEEDLDIDSILTKSENLEEEERERKRREVEDDGKLLFDEDESDLEFIRKEVKDQVSDNLETSKEDGEEKELQEEAFEEKSEKEPEEAKGEEEDEEIEIEDEDFVFDWDEMDEEGEVDELEALLGIKNARKLLLNVGSLVVGLFIFMGLLTVSAYMFIGRLNAQKEIVVAQSLADLAMSMIHKKLYDPMGPTDVRSPLFMERHISPVLALGYLETSPLIEKTFFHDVDYQVSIHYNRDRTRFLLLAKPLKNWQQTLVPKVVLFVDSDLMDLRKGGSLELWNSVVKEDSSLEEIKEFEFSTLLSRGSVIHLAALDSGEGRDNRYTPPRGLEDLRFKAEDKIYNAPRYYPFTAAAMHMASRLSKVGGSAEDVNSFRKAVKVLSELEDLVFYSPDGLKEAKEGYKALQAYLPEYTPLLAYLFVDSETQKVTNARLLGEDELPEDRAVPIVEGVLPAYDEEDSEQRRGFIEESIEHVTVDQDPLKESIFRIAEDRKAALEEINEEMDELIFKHNREGVANFGKKYLVLFDHYQSVDRDYQEGITAKLEELYEEYVQKDSKKDTVSTFMSLIEEAQLSAYLSKELEDEIHNIQQTPIIQEDMEGYLNEIVESETLQELGLRVRRVVNLFSSGRVRDPGMLVSYRNQLRDKVLQRLGYFLLSSEATKTEMLLQKGNRDILNGILQDSEISKEDERNFYIQEFDALMTRLRSEADVQELSELKEINQSLEKYAVYDDLSSDQEKDREIDEQKESLDKIQRKLIQVPVVSTHTLSSKEERKNLGKRGQQMLISAGLQEPSEERDHVLENAIGLLQEDLSNNRGLWGDILEARRLLTQTPEKQIVEVFNSGIGFMSLDRPLYDVIKAMLIDYFEEKKKLVEVRDEDQFYAQYDFFKTKKKALLKEVSRNIEKLQREANKFIQGMQEYERRLRVFSDDYEQAKIEGFFVESLHVQSLMAARLGRKTYRVEMFHKKVSKLIGQLIEASQRHGEIVEKELSLLEEPSRVTLEEVTKLDQEVHQTVYPNLVAEDLKSKMDNILNIQISPPLL